MGGQNFSNSSDFFVPLGYKIRDNSLKKILTVAPENRNSGIFAFASYLRQFGRAKFILDLGCGSAFEEGRSLDPRFLIAVGEGQALQASRRRFPEASFLQMNVGANLQLPDEILAQCIVVCNQQLELLQNPSQMLQGLARISQKAPYLLIGGLDRERAYQKAHLGPPHHPKRVREWSLEEMVSLCNAHGIHVQSSGYTSHHRPRDGKKDFCIISGSEACYQESPKVRALAIVSCYNDRDIIRKTVQHVLNEGLDVWIIDNWSTDETWSVLQEMKHQNPNRIVEVERFPKEAPDQQYNWHGILQRKEDIAHENHDKFDWFIHYDSDELRTSPWPGITMVDAISRIHALGYNAIDHTLIDFRPIVDGFDATKAPEEFFTHFEFNELPSAFLQIKGWAAQKTSIDLKSTGGHAANFAERRVFPLKFLLSHYPLRSTAQGQRKVFKDRLARYGLEEKSRGWHVHYKDYEKKSGHEFLWKRVDLVEYDYNSFHKNYLLERLSGLYIDRR